MKQGFKWFIFDKPSVRDIRRMTCEVMPDSVLNALSCLWNSSQPDELYKYKKLFFDGEI